MAIFQCPACKGRAHGDMGSTPQSIRLQRHPRGAETPCPATGQEYDKASLGRLPRKQADAERQHQMSGRRAWQDGGVCGLCPDPILKDERIVRRGESWIHVRCCPGQDDL